MATEIDNALENVNRRLTDGPCNVPSAGEIFIAKAILLLAQQIERMVDLKEGENER